jgi:SHS2 domain-containing protein
LQEETALGYNSPMTFGRKPYRLISHTGDLGMTVQGKDRVDLFEQSAWAFFDLLVDVRKIKPIKPLELSVEAVDREALLVAWLGELLYLFDARRLVFSRFEIEELTDRSLKARAWGEDFDRERHGFKHGIKAVTYHQVQIRETPKGWRARVILDI